MRLRSNRSTARSASVTGVRSGLVSTTRSEARNRSVVMPSAMSASSKASSRSRAFSSGPRRWLLGVVMRASLRLRSHTDRPRSALDGVVVEGVQRGLRQDADPDWDGALVGVEEGGVQVQVGAGDADAEPGHRAGNVLEV